MHKVLNRVQERSSHRLQQIRHIRYHPLLQHPALRRAPVRPCQSGLLEPRCRPHLWKVRCHCFSFAFWAQSDILKQFHGSVASPTHAVADGLVLSERATSPSQFSLVGQTRSRQSPVCRSCRCTQCCTSAVEQATPSTLEHRCKNHPQSQPVGVRKWTCDCIFASRYCSPLLQQRSTPFGPLPPWRLSFPKDWQCNLDRTAESLTSSGINTLKALEAFHFHEVDGNSKLHTESFHTSTSTSRTYLGATPHCLCPHEKDLLRYHINHISHTPDCPQVLFGVPKVYLEWCSPPQWRSERPHRPLGKGSW